MAPFSGDGVLWLCLGMGISWAKSWSMLLTLLGVSLFFAVRGIATDLRQVVDLTEIKHVEQEDKIISEGTEEGMRFISRFCRLYADSLPSPKIRHTSQVISKHEP